MKTLYSTVHDVDYIVGALLETPENGSMVGPSTACVIGDGFYRFKAGDRFFYDVQGQPGSFTEGTYISDIRRVSIWGDIYHCVISISEQLKTLKKVTLSHVICATSHLDHLQKETFRYVDHE